MKSIQLCLVIAIATLGWGSQSAQAASAVGTAKLKVISAIAISNVSDLDFGQASPGDAARAIPAGTAETESNGSFQVKGEAGASYTISLPTVVNLTNPKSSGSVAVTDFASSPSRSGIIGAQGTQMLFVGATRAALPATLAAGDYSGSYSVTVVY